MVDKSSNPRALTETCSLCKSSQIDLNSLIGIPICSNCWDLNRNYKFQFQAQRTILSPQIDQISENVFLGNADAQRDKEKLKTLGITHILVAGAFLEIHHPKDFEYVQFQINGYFEDNISQFFEKAFEFIEKSDKVFVHCERGVCRSASLVIAYFMKKNKMTLEESFNFVKSKRSIIDPHGGFMKQLKNYVSNNK